MKYDLEEIQESLSSRKTFSQQISTLDTKKRSELEYQISELRRQLDGLEKKKQELQKQAALDAVPEFLFFKEECEKFYAFLRDGIKHSYKVLDSLCRNGADSFSAYSYYEGIRKLAYERISPSANGVGDILIKDFTISGNDVVFAWEHRRILFRNNSTETRVPVRWFTDRKNLIEEFRNSNETQEQIARAKVATEKATNKLQRKIRRSGGDDKYIELSSQGTLFDSEKFLVFYDSLDPSKLREYHYPYAAMKSLCDYAFVIGQVVYCEDIFRIFAEPLEITNKEVYELHKHAINEVHVKVFGELVNRHEIFG